jgi:Transglutaminase elicitor
MQASLISLVLVTSSLAQYGPPVRVYSSYGQIRKDELEGQQQTFKQWWGDELVLTLADLPVEGKVPDFRIPYAGHDYPDRMGGTVNVMYKYDQAFHRGRPLAAEYERMDVSAHRNGRSEERIVRGLFGRIRVIRSDFGVPTWYGHCNGWTAAAIRHAEPQRSVVRNGVTFTPADIKAMLAELYMYSDSEFLGGIDLSINPGILHLTLANWLGRGSHPVGMETAVGEVVINFPIFKYKSTIHKFSSREADVRTIITYALNINREMDRAPPNYHRQMYFHYVLELDEAGAIRGGRFFGDSAQIDMLWVPRQPTQGGEEGNKRGNPHLNVKEVLAIWRDSVSEDLRKKWLNIDPTDEDRVLPPSEAVVTADRPAAPASPIAPPTGELREPAVNAAVGAVTPVPSATSPAAASITATEAIASDAPVERPGPIATPTP